VTITPYVTLPRAAAVLARLGVRRLPVVDENGRLAGVLSRNDVLRAFLRPDGEIAREVETDVLRRTMCIDPAAVRVRVIDGVVVLGGQLERSGMGPVVESLVGSVAGVVAVVNELTYAIDDTDGHHQ
jgi:CBS domain-containing protein